MLRDAFKSFDNKGMMSNGPRILVADDAPTVTLLLTRALEAAGYEVIAVDDGVAAYQAGVTGDFDLALLDHLMPGMLGAEVLQRWNEESVPFKTIILSGMDDDDLVIQLLELGAVDFIRKPFNIKELLVRVRLQLPATRAAG
jgi:DNA-binding response OmpR family regulator